jgi:hypothetical protein
MRSRRAASFQSAGGIWSSSSFHAKVVFLRLYKLRKNLEKLYSLKQNIVVGGRREVMWNQTVTVFLAGRMWRACSTNEGKTILNKAKSHPVSKRINPLESANTLYSIRKSDSELRPKRGR